MSNKKMRKLLNTGPIIEMLENRRLLSADLSGSFIGAVPDAVSLQKLNKVTVDVQNVGDATATGPVTITLYASSIGILDLSTDTALGSPVTKTLHLKANKGIKVPLKFAAPTGVADGNYFLLADIEPSAQIGDVNAGNNVVSSPSTVSIKKAFIDLTGSVSTNINGTVNIVSKHQKAFTVSVLVANEGNVPAKGPLTIDVYAATHQTFNSTDTLLTPKTVNVSIKNGKSKKLVIKEILNTSVPSGTFFIVANINSTNTIAESSTANNVVSTPDTANFNNPLIAAGPYLAGSLSSSISSSMVGEPVQDQFQITVGRASSSTAVQVDEFDSSGNDLGEIVQLVDDGTNGDPTANDGIYTGIATINSTAPGTRNFAAVVSDSQLSANLQSANVSIVATNPLSPSLVGTLKSSTVSVIIGQSTLTHFAIKVANASSSTKVEVDEFDASGNNLGKLTDLFDNGSPANGDVTAGDGIFSGVNTVAATAPGTRYFAAVLNDSTILSGLVQSATVGIGEVNPPSQMSLQTDIADNSSLNTTAANVLNGGGTPQAAIAAVQAALPADANVVSGTVQTTPTSIEWQTVDGTYQGVSTDFLSTQSDLGGPASLSTAAVTTPPQTVTAADSTTGDATQSALILSPFATSLAAYDPSNNIAAQFTTANYSVTQHSDSQVTFGDFKNLGQYAAVNLYGHGTQLAIGGEGVYLGIPTSAATSLSEAGDLLNNRVVIMNDHYVITPDFITTYAGDLGGAIVEFNACSSLHDTTMGDAFIGQGAGAYIGYTNTVNAVFAENKAISTWQTLLKTTNNTVGDIPGINVDHDTHAIPAVFSEDGPLTATLPQPNLLKNNNVYVQYNWPQNVSDLDSNTTFLGGSVGYALPGGSYLNWSGDNTGAGGSETTTVDIYQAWMDKAWASSTTISVGADWYTPAGGSGPAYITVALQNKSTGALTHVTNETVNPGQETDGTMTVVGTINVVLGGDPTNPTVKITLM